MLSSAGAVALSPKPGRLVLLHQSIGKDNRAGLANNWHRPENRAEEPVPVRCLDVDNDISRF